MQLTIISDTHGRHEKLGNLSGEVLIHCGDICDAEKDASITAVREMDAWFSRQHFEKIICIGGNHDFAVQELAATSQPVFENAVYLEDEAYIYKGVTFYGSPWTPNLDGWAFYQSEKGIQKKWDAISRDADVLITHAPPWQILDVPYMSNQHAGCPNLRIEVEILRPKVHCFGHIHAGYGKIQTPHTCFVNACISNGPKLNPPIILEI